MLRTLARLVIGAVAIAISAAAHAQAPPPRCARPEDLPKDSVRAMARRLYPEALTPENPARFVTVGLLFGPRCELLRHAAGRRPAEGGAVGTFLTRLIPEAREARFAMSGGMDAFPRQGSAAGRPMIVWGVVRAPDGRR
jgi:hypothetical protein